MVKAVWSLAGVALMLGGLAGGAGGEKTTRTWRRANVYAAVQFNHATNEAVLIAVNHSLRSLEDLRFDVEFGTAQRVVKRMKKMIPRMDGRRYVLMKLGHVEAPGVIISFEARCMEATFAK